MHIDQDNAAGLADKRIFEARLLEKHIMTEDEVAECTQLCVDGCKGLCSCARTSPAGDGDGWTWVDSFCPSPVAPVGDEMLIINIEEPPPKQPTLEPGDTRLFIDIDASEEKAIVTGSSELDGSAPRRTEHDAINICVQNFSTALY